MKLLIFFTILAYVFANNNLRVFPKKLLYKLGHRFQTNYKLLNGPPMDKEEALEMAKNRLIMFEMVSKKSGKTIQTLVDDFLSETYMGVANIRQDVWNLDLEGKVKNTDGSVHQFTQGRVPDHIDKWINNEKIKENLHDAK